MQIVNVIKLNTSRNPSRGYRNFSALAFGAQNAPKTWHCVNFFKSKGKLTIKSFVGLMLFASPEQLFFWENRSGLAELRDYHAVQHHSCAITVL